MDLKKYEYYRTDLGVLYCGDCLEIMPHLPKVDLVLTDPPYGLGDRMIGGNGEWSRNWEVNPEWDITTSRGVDSLPQNGKVIIWGGNYYPLPPARGWLVWDKKQNHSSGHCELAWTNLDQPIRKYELSRIEAYSRMNKQHPTQKPIGLILWCLSFADGLTLDPFLGSGTTAVACERLNRKWIGIEISEKYCEIAAKRIENERKQLKLFS